MPPELVERVATLEAQQREGERVHAALFEKVDDQGSDLQAIRRDVAQIREQLSGYKGFWAGMVFAASAAAAVIGALAAALWRKLGG